VIARPMPADQLIEWLGARPAWSKTSNSARTALGKLALLLIWEERLHLIGNDRPASERLAEIVGIPPDASAIPATPSLPDSWCRDCELSTFFTGVDALLSGAATERTAAQAMLNAAVAHGPRSAAYSASRELLISALSVGESVA